ncbi:putative SLC26A/SulP transporter [Helianthus anomalus]
MLAKEVTEDSTLSHMSQDIPDIDFEEPMSQKVLSKMKIGPSSLALLAKTALMVFALLVKAEVKAMAFVVVVDFTRSWVAREILQSVLWQWSLCSLELCYEMRLSQIHLNIYVLLSLQHSLLESLKLHSGFSDWVFMGGAVVTIALQHIKGLLGIKDFTKNADLVPFICSVVNSVHHGVC